MIHIQLLAYDNCMASAVVGPMDLFAIANSYAHLVEGRQTALFDCQIVTVDGQPTHCSNGIKLQAHSAIDHANGADVIMVPGIHFSGFKTLNRDFSAMQSTCQWLQQQHENGSIIASSCTGSFLLGIAGLLKNHQSTTTWWLAERFQKQFPSTELRLDRLVCQDQRIITAGATSAYWNLCLHLIEMFYGYDIALGCSKILLIDLNPNSQLTYQTPPQLAGHDDTLVGKAQQWLREHMAEAVSLEQLADYLAVSKRTLIRRFKDALDDTPAHYLQQIRMGRAKELLESTALSLEDIATQVGYQDPSAFRRQFQKHTELSPSAYRKRFALAPALRSGGNRL